MNLTPWVIGWAVLAVVVIALAVYRWIVANREDDSIHISDTETEVIGQQITVATKLAVVDRWGKILTAVALVYALALVGVYLYQGWVGTGISPVS